MTLVHKPLQSGDTAYRAKGWPTFGHGDGAVRYTEAWEHETFAEEQARWERTDVEYARICEQVRQTRNGGGEASRRADEVKAKWDARVAAQRQANDDAQRAHHALNVDPAIEPRPAMSLASSPRPCLVIRARQSHHRMRTVFAIESDDSPAPGTTPEPLGLHEEPAATPAPRGGPQAARLSFRGPMTRKPESNRPTELEVE